MKKNHIPKEYVFRFKGTKDAFLYALYHCDYYSENYMVRIVDDEIYFGVERCGHSGGNWFVSSISEIGDEVELRGIIRYIGLGDDGNKKMRFFDLLGIVFGIILLLPILIIYSIYSAVKWCIRKIRKRPKSKNTEDKLYDLMENHLNCIRTQNPNRL